MENSLRSVLDQLLMQNTFTDILRPDQILTSPQDLLHYGKDWLKDFTPHPSVILLPTTTVEVQKIVRRCNEKRISLVPSGGRTGLSGGATATKGEVILSLERMNKILGVNELDRAITVEAGVVTQRVQDEAAKNHLYFPVEFTTKGSSHIGGNVATNAGGIRVVKYGHTRDWVLGMKVVTGNGDILDLNGALVKNNTGYDLRALFMGSEGTLGIITQLTLSLTHVPHERRRSLLALPSVDSVMTIFKRTRATFPDMSAFEFFTEGGLSKVLAHNALTRPFSAPHEVYLLIEVEQERNTSGSELEDLFAAFIEEGLVSDVVISQNQKQAEELIELRERIGETLSKHYFPHKNDLSVPVSNVIDFVSDLTALIKKEYPDFEVVVFGHIGDGNLHVNVLKPPALTLSEFLSFCERADEAMFALVAKHKGSISAEHGIGLLKKKFLHFSRSDVEVSLMKSIKRTFDPNLILNPGKIFDVD